MVKFNHILTTCVTSHELHYKIKSTLNLLVRQCIGWVAFKETNVQHLHLINRQVRSTPLTHYSDDRIHSNIIRAQFLQISLRSKGTENAAALWDSGEVTDGHCNTLDLHHVQPSP